MQSWFTTWLALPVPALFVSLFAFYLFTAALMVWLSFRSRLSRRIQSFKGVVAPFFGSTAIVFGLLVAFLSNDIWERNKQAERIVFTESEPYSVAVLNVSDSPIAEGIELLEPQLLMLGDQALILRGYECLRNEEGPFTVLQEWRCEPV